MISCEVWRAIALEPSTPLRTYLRAISESCRLERQKRQPTLPATKFTLVIMAIPHSRHTKMGMKRCSVMNVTIPGTEPIWTISCAMRKPHAGDEVGLQLQTCKCSQTNHIMSIIPLLFQASETLVDSFSIASLPTHPFPSISNPSSSYPLLPTIMSCVQTSMALGKHRVTLERIVIWNLLSSQ